MSYVIYPSKKKHKKYDVFKDDRYLLSYGDKRYQQFKDSTPIGAYSHLDHLDLKRRDNFRKRFQHLDHENPDKSIHWSWHTLW